MLQAGLLVTLALQLVVGSDDADSTCTAAGIAHCSSGEAMQCADACECQLLYATCVKAAGCTEAELPTEPGLAECINGGAGFLLAPFRA